MHPGDSAFAGRRALVVDDLATNRLVLVRLLRGFGLECLEACDGHEGFEVWRHHLPELVFMDLQMPVLDGFGAIELIQDEVRRLGCPMPILLAVTANVFEEHRERCRKAGLDGFLEKPLSRARLREALAALPLGKLKPPG